MNTPDREGVNEKAIVTQPGKANREFESPTQAISYAVDQHGPFQIYWKGVVILSRGTPQPD